MTVSGQVLTIGGQSLNIGKRAKIEGVNAKGFQFTVKLFGGVATSVPSFGEGCDVLRTFAFGTGQEVDVGFFGGVDGVGAPCGAAEELEDVIRLCHNKVVSSRHGDVDE